MAVLRRAAYSDMRRGEGCIVDGLDSVVVVTIMVKIPFCVEQPDGIATDQATQRVAHDAQLPDDAAVVAKKLDMAFNFPCHSLAPRLYAVIGQVPPVALGRQDMKLVRPVLLAQGCAYMVEMPRMAVQTVVISPVSIYLVPYNS